MFLIKHFFGSKSPACPKYSEPLGWNAGQLSSSPNHLHDKLPGGRHRPRPPPTRTPDVPSRVRTTQANRGGAIGRLAREKPAGSPRLFPRGDILWEEVRCAVSFAHRVCRGVKMGKQPREKEGNNCSTEPDLTADVYENLTASSNDSIC